MIRNVDDLSVLICEDPLISGISRSTDGNENPRRFSGTRTCGAPVQRIISNVLVEGNIFKNSRQRSGMIVSMSDAGGYGNHIENVTIRNNIYTGNDRGGLILQGIARDVKI